MKVFDCRQAILHVSQSIFKKSKKISALKQLISTLKEEKVFDKSKYVVKVVKMPSIRLYIILLTWKMFR